MKTERENAVTVSEVVESWHAPGYRDSELFFKTERGDFHFKLSPQAFVELHNMLCGQQDCIDRNGHAPLDIEHYPFNTTHVATLRRNSP